MLSTLTIISIFTEMFSAAVLLSGAFSVLKRYISKKSTGDLLATLVLTVSSAYVSLVIASQLLHNVGRPLVEVIVMQKAISLCLIGGSFLLFMYLMDKFGYMRSPIAKLIAIVLGIAAFSAGFCALFSQVSLKFVADAIEPIASFSLPCDALILWSGMWLFAFLLFLFNSFRAATPKRNILLLGGAASFLFVLGYVFRIFYVFSADSIDLLTSWVAMFCASLGFVLGELIQPEDKLALAPLTFFKSRILYKLVLIFILLVIVLLEVTTLLTIKIGRDAMIREAVDRQKFVARNVSANIAVGGTAQGKLDLSFTNELVRGMNDKETTIFVVNSAGRVVAHPDASLLGRDLSGLKAVKLVSSGKSGSASYNDPMLPPPNDKVFGAFAPIRGTPFGVIVEEPEQYMYDEIRSVETNSLIFVMAGILLTIIVGVFFARSIESPIKEVIAGTEAVRRGNLNRRINVASEDEIGQLAQAFNQMTLDLRDTQEHLIASEKLASLGTMAAGMAHEIKNPLVSLRTFTQLLEQKFDDPEFRRKFSVIVPQEIDHINRIAESLLKFGRPSKPEFAKVSVNKLLEEVLDLLDNECRRNNVRVTTKLATLPEVTADAMQLSQAFVNIVLNAIQAMQQGGELTVKTDVGEVIRLGRAIRKVPEKSADNGASVSEGMLGEVGEGSVSELYNRPVPVIFVEITDTGCGMEEENLKKLFDPFFTTKISGTGMGLPITLRIIEDHKGSVKVKSKSGQGTTFIVTLPQNMQEV